MFLLKRTTLAAAAAATALSLALFTGCKTSAPKPAPESAPATPAIPPVSKTNAPPPLVASSPDTGDTMASNILAWDATEKVYRAQPGELKAPFTFNLTNVSSSPVVIYDTSTTCDCTVASLPSKPWTLPSGAAGKIEASIDLQNKIGTVTNSIIVFTSQGNRRLRVKAILPAD
jgi:hypothetical protein